MADAKRLARNTFFMYGRMLVIMFVAIFTSRVVLDKLGIDDYGLYNAVASAVAMISFLNATLSTSTSRFITYDLGKGNKLELRATFSTSFYSHLMLAGIVVIVLETIGLWYMGHRFVIPEGREFATYAIYQISIITAVVAIMQVPFTASIMAHEDMNIYAYVGLFEVFAKLCVVYLLSITPFDKLIFYAILIAVVQIITTSFYIIACVRRYDEINISERFNKYTFRGMLGFTGWTAVANLSSTMIVQGATVLLNLFFAPYIIAAKALANQISHAIMSFVDNFRVALNPQIIKTYASGDIAPFRTLALRSTIISFDLVLILGLPCIFTMKTILNIWLVEVPETAVEFTQIAIFSRMVGTISSSTYIPFVASGKLKNNSICGTITGFLYFVILYFIFKVGGGPLWAQWLSVINGFVFVLILRPYLLHKEIGFSYREIFVCNLTCFKVLLSTTIISFIISSFLNESLWQQAILFISVFVVSVLSSWIFLERPIRDFIIQIVKSRIKRIK